MNTKPAEEGHPRSDGYPPVIVYTSNDCAWCVRAKEYLSRRGVPYEERNVDENEAYGPDITNLTGQRHVPVIVVGSTAVVGFKKLELDAELDALLNRADPKPFGGSVPGGWQDGTNLDPRE